MLDKEKFIKGYYTNKDVCDLIKLIESNLKLHKWYCSSINLWTVVRNSLVTLILTSRGSISMPTQESYFQKTILLKTLCIAKDAFIGLIQINIIILANLFKKASVLLVGDGISKSFVSDKWVDKFLDPLRYYYDLKNINTLFLDVNKSPHKPLYSKVFNIDKIEKMSYFFSRLYLIFQNKQILDSVERTTLKYYLDQFGIDSSDWTVKNITIKYYQIVILSFFFKIILKSIKVKKIYIVAYYNLYGYALCRAAAQLNIKSIDIQHGILENHPAYQFFGDINFKNSLLPDLFWVWDRHAHRAFIKNNTTSFLKYHRSFPGGLPWNLWKNEEKFRIDRMDVEPFFDSSKVNILVSMQPEFFGRNLWENLIPIIEKNTNCFWWIRKHPAFSNDCYQLNNIDCADYSNVNFIDAYRLPIYTLLDHCDLHITTDSSSALDADKLNVPTIFLSDMCYEYFTHLMVDKKAVYCDSVESIESYISTIIKKPS